MILGRGRHVLWVLLWAFAAFGLSHLFDRLVPDNPTLITMARVFKNSKYEWLTPFFRYDSVHYLRIVNMGYEHPYRGLTAFFPVFPLWVRLASHPLFLWTGDRLYSAVLTAMSTNLVFLCLSISMAADLFRKDFGAKGAWMLAILFLGAPYAFYYLAFYAEAIFLFLTLAAFWAASRRYWWLAGLAAAIVSATRVQGILVFPALGIEYLWQKEWKLKQVRLDVLWLILCPAGLVLFLIHIGGYANYIYSASGWNQRVLNWNVFWPLVRFFWLAVTERKVDFSDTVSVLCILTAVGLLIYGWKSLRPSYRCYAVLSLCVPMLTTVVQAVGRYYMVLFPLYFSAVLYFRNRPKILWALLAVSFLLQLKLISMFVNGYWVA